MKLNLFRLAFRNLFRNKRRTIITLVAITFGAISSIILGGVLESSMQGLREQNIRSVIGGHLNLSLEIGDKNIDSISDKIIAQDIFNEVEDILQAEEHIRIHAAKIDGISGLVGNYENSATFIADGLNPEQEAKLRSWATIIDGTRLSSDDLNGVLIGKGLAEILEIEVGEYLTAVVTEGGLNAIDVQVQGIFETGTYEYDKRAMIMTLENAQMLLNVTGIKSISILIDDTDNTNVVAESLRKNFAERNLPIRVKTWEEDALYYRQVSGFLHGLFRVVKIILVIMITVGIANTIMMSVMERTREIGTLNAIGFKSHQIIRLFLTEAALLGLIGGVIGCILGSVLIQWLAVLGVEVPPPPGSTTGFVLIPLIVPKEFIYALVSSVVISVLSAIYPASLASRREPVDALRHV